ncbi:hypothetical protein KY290_018206 [Solanum tuberosum]|uniref:Reverse transcriptase zinc-binding domain-containing protein n=2 Tax=Solanum tuberosum TaxID=4113 RepID=A0ABQ7VEB8_SOLTU|nr:hypothetical protein KY284_017148 [Solanum tuberosum]KAH0702887.1 hypothetical protein KY285_017165 [Solanum tuberosum]KAH0762133.1 hypothetical protein KY290_018206 [Solanum tuberosum]
MNFPTTVDPTWQTIHKGQIHAVGVIESKLCPLCGIEHESIDHLFFQCSFSSSIWSKLLLWQGDRRSTMKWQEEIQWAVLNANGKNVKATMYRASIVACAYLIWQEKHKSYPTEAEKS